MVYEIEYKHRRSNSRWWGEKSKICMYVAGIGRGGGGKRGEGGHFDFLPIYAMEIRGKVCVLGKEEREKKKASR